MGGNNKLNDFLSNYDLYSDVQQKYNSTVAQHYRDSVTKNKLIPGLRLV